MSVAIRVEKIGKHYRIGARQARPKTMREALAYRMRAPLHNLRHLRSPVVFNRAGPADMIWALSDISFEVREGEVLGIVGSNGAGKSTLLKVLSRITAPSTGRAWVRGQMGTLLEVGTGFHPELSGRDNIYLNGAILGMNRHYITSRFDEIVAFADGDRFLDTAVKHYSTGMYLRLAFAVAAHLASDILVVDEVLAVGDAGFQKKCLAKMSEVASEGRTILFVSHNLGAIQRMCPRSVLLHGGRLVADGATEEVLRTYLALSPDASQPRQWLDLSHAQRTGSHQVQIQAIEYHSPDAQIEFRPYPDGPLELTLELISDRHRTIGSLGISLQDHQGARLISADTMALGLLTEVKEGRNRIKLSIESLHLNPGVYYATVWVSGPRGRPVYDRIESAFTLQVIDRNPAAPGQTGATTCHLQVLPVD
jgi:lipopolysaccharide transport system ATP-binding protein